MSNMTNGDKGYVVRKDYNGNKEAVLFATNVLQLRGEIAVELVSKWGMVAGTPDGEDSTGRQKLRLLTPEELVERACKTSALLVESMQVSNWMLNLPCPANEVEIASGNVGGLSVTKVSDGSEHE